VWGDVLEEVCRASQRRSVRNGLQYRVRVEVHVSDLVTRLPVRTYDKIRKQEKENKENKEKFEKIIF
jgi:hypothetical protein